MRALLDENIHVKVLNWLVASSHDAIRVPTGWKNGQVIELARRERRVLITQDKDFANRLLYPPAQCHGIVILRIHPPQLTQLTAALQRVFDVMSESEIIGKLIVVDDRECHRLS